MVMKIYIVFPCDQVRIRGWERNFTSFANDLQFL